MKYNIQLELIRVIAIVLVMYNHYYCYDFFLTCNNPNLLHYMLLIPSIICKCGPPLFFMISGALLLGKKESCIYIISHRVFRIFIVMIFASCLTNYKCLTISNVLNCLFSGLNWYFYAYLGFLLLLPLYRAIAQNLNIEEWQWVIAIIVLANVINGLCIILNVHFSVLDNIQPLVSGWASCSWQWCFPLLGFYVSENIGQFKANKFKWTIISILSIVISMIFIRIDVLKTGGTNYEMFHEYFIVAPTILIFGSVISLKTIPDFLNQAIKYIAPLTFGMFILETQTSLSTTIFGIVYSGFTHCYGLIITSWICIVLKFIIFSIVIYIFRLFPVIKKFI